jgi:hypothetical protein
MLFNGVDALRFIAAERPPAYFRSIIVDRLANRTFNLQLSSGRLFALYASDTHTSELQFSLPPKS